MTKNVTTQLKAHLAQDLTTLATCWLITRTDGQVFAFTDHDVDIVYAGHTYAAATGFTASAVSTTAQLNVDNLDCQGMLSSATITEGDLYSGLWDYATISIFQVNWADLTQGARSQRDGRMGEVKAGVVAFTAEVRGLMQALQQTVGEAYSYTCRANVFDTRCGLVAATYTGSGTITGVTSPRAFADSARSEVDGYFNSGVITFTSGLNVGLSMEIRSYLLAGGALTLKQAMPFAVAVGDAYTILPGCDHLKGTCKTKFGVNNLVHFRGEPDIPGADAILYYPNSH